MGTNVIVRRIAQGMVVLCAAGCALAATRHDWPDAALIGLLGAWAVVTARKMAWKLRLAAGTDTTYSAWPDLASSSRVSPAAPMSSSCNSNHTV
ncbi:MAG: hypothetical protein QOH27_5964 [Mycobacterium sp.]|jgi:hypothetical protein|nr:hypothetical protein [Mycobacterium sp.]